MIYRKKTLLSSSLAIDSFCRLLRKGLLVIPAGNQTQVLVGGISQVIVVLQELCTNEKSKFVHVGFNRESQSFGFLLVRICEKSSKEDNPAPGESTPYYHDVCGASIECSLLDAAREIEKHFPDAIHGGGDGLCDWFYIKGSEELIGRAPSVSRAVRERS